MRRFVMVSTVFFLILVGGSAAVGEDRNELGLYCDPNDLSTTSITLPGDSYLELYLVLKNPYFDGTGKKVQLVTGFECRVETGLVANLLSYLHDDFFINIATLPDIVVGFGSPGSVVDGEIVLGRIALNYLGEDPSYFSFSPISQNPSIPGHMAFAGMDAHGEEFLCPMYPISGGFENPVFAINGSVVPVESETWGGVKALYR